MLAVAVQVPSITTNPVSLHPPGQTPFFPEELSRIRDFLLETYSEKVLEKQRNPSVTSQRFIKVVVHTGGDDRNYSDKAVIQEKLGHSGVLKWFRDATGDQTLRLARIQVNFMTDGQFTFEHDHLDVDEKYFGVLMLQNAIKGGEFYTTNTRNGPKDLHPLKEGDMIIAPSHVRHGNMMVIGSGIRITVAFDLH